VGSNVVRCLSAVAEYYAIPVRSCFRTTSEAPRRRSNGTAPAVKREESAMGSADRILEIERVTFPRSGSHLSPPGIRTPI
jgi:hypothetical protein